MRLAAIGSALAIVLCVAVFGAVFLKEKSISDRSQPSLLAASAERQASEAVVPVADKAAEQAQATPDAPTVIAQASPPAIGSPSPPPACSNPDALGIARVVEIDTTGGPGFGFE